MPLVRRLARPLLASSFIAGGVETFVHPDETAPKAKKVVSDLPSRLPLIKNTKQLVQVDAAVKVVAGLLLASGRLPRPAALALAASLVPTTLAGHRFWEETDPESRREQQRHFLKNASMLGGLILAAVDTAGKPSLGWRTRTAAAALGGSAGDQASSVGERVSALYSAVGDKLPVGSAS